MAEKFLVLFCSVYGLMLLFSVTVSGLKPTKDMVREWANRLGTNGSSFMDGNAGVKSLTQAYENFTYATTERINGVDVLKKMKKEMEVFFRNKSSSLKKLVKKAEEAYCKYKYDKNLKISEIDYPNSKDLDKYLNKSGIKLEYNSTFRSEISFNRSVIHVPTDVFDGASKIVNGIEWTSALESVFEGNRHEDPSLSWQYFGSDEGFMRTYPARHWDITNENNVDLFDARKRPWYIQGATSPKNIIILIDASGSMHGVPMRIAKLSAQNLIDTFGDNDFFNVVYFNVEATVLCCEKEGPILLQATKKNKIFVKEELKKIADKDVAVWEKGMKKAFDLLEKANNFAKCQEAIMVLSDGTTSSLLELFAELNPDKKVRVFTFAVGPSAESTEALRNMACNNRGYFTRIQSVGAVREVSESYIRVLTRPMAMAPEANTTDHTVWTSVYLDALGLGMMVTGTLPVFHRKESAINCSEKGGMEAEEKREDHFLGVMGADVPLKYLKDFMLRPLVGLSGYMFAVNNNGMIIFHPRLKTVYGYLQDPPGVDLVDVETSVTGAEVQELRKAMIDKVPITADGPSHNGSSHKEFEVYDLSFDELRMTKRTMNYYFGGLEGTSFSLGIATPLLGYKYNLPEYTETEVIDKLHSELKETNKDIQIERWPYCRNVVLAEKTPLEQLINETESRDTKLCNNSELLTGLLVDLNVTARLPSVWKSKARPGVNDVFVRTYWGLHRSHSGSKDKRNSSSEDDIFRRVFGSQIPPASIIYTTKYLAAKSDENITSVFAYKRIYRNKFPAAILGYEMDMKAFVDTHIVKNTECQSEGSACDISCDRTGKNDYEGLYCYLVDENGFVVAGNDESSAGKFFGRVDAPVMRQLIRSNEENGSGIYNKVVLTDFQAVCQVKGGVNSGGVSFLLKPFFSLSAYAEWWTTKAVWSLLYFNLYSWIFAESGATTEATDDIPKNISCIRNITTYYADQGNVTLNGVTSCGDCSREHFVASVRHSNVYLVVINATCGKCDEIDREMGVPGEPREIPRDTVENSCKEPGYRKRPKRCFVSTNPESGYACGSGSFIKPSPYIVTLQLFWLFAALRRIVGFV
ncbi:voltage-dependent calcium channel subunit alpha-2/delta-3-like [Pocillopora damicornis]|uniref:voltage-dependent calcium channel subunit alpha-2/delta-3-like n=1 Tax=Pocillopora damicornis TaxID=46731 RepID=UPI000F551B93|nr:voltage-dependent calcium channel subunit alpha-2/delta-3-like [Pocillopora damicornis]